MTREKKQSRKKITPRKKATQATQSQDKEDHAMEKRKLFDSEKHMEKGLVSDKLPVNDTVVPSFSWAKDSLPPNHVSR